MWSQEVDPLLRPAARESFRLLISKEAIGEKLQDAARRIDADFAGEEIAILVVLKGAMFIASDLVSRLESPCTVDCIRAMSYGARGDTRGDLEISGLSQIDIQGKNVLVVEDIFDSGATLSAVVAELEKLGPKTVRSVVLLTKRVEHATDYRPNYSLFEIEDHFVIGYGLDYKERWRNLPGIYIAR